MVDEVFDPVAEGLTTEGYPGERKGPKPKVSGWDRLMQQTRYDQDTGARWESGEPIMRGGAGLKYTIKRDPDQRTLRTKIEEDIIPAVADWVDDPSLPSKEDMMQFGKDFVEATADSLEKTVSGTGTLGEAMEWASGAGAANTGAKVLTKTPAKPSRTPSFNAKLYPEEDFSDDLVEQGGMLVDSSFGFKTPDTLEEALSLKVSEFEEKVKNFKEGSITGEEAKKKLEALEKLGDNFFITAAESIPHYNDQMYGEYLDRLENISKENNLNPYYVKQLVQDLDADFQNIYGQKIDPVIRDVATSILPDQQRIGERASDWWYLEGSPERPSDKKALDLNFTDTVYHSSIAPKEFTKFNLDKSYVEGSQRSAQDFLGVHVGTARAAAERNLDAVRNSDEPVGFTMELRARTDKPFTKAEAKKLFKNYSPKGNDTFSEEEVNKLIEAQADELFKSSEEILPENYRTLAAIELRKKLAKEGYTHIPYINDVEDPGSTSFIMLVDRPKDSPAVLRDVRAQFDPEKITDPDLRFAEGGLAVEEQMNKLYQEGGLADDGTDIEPVTGNEVPTGSMDQEVRDNIPAQLSEGEYVVPADVVRYYGVKFFEDLRGKAKEDFARMEAEGRVGGEPVDTNGMPMEQEEELTPEEMQMLAEALGQSPSVPTGMAMGGMVPQQQAYDPYAQQQMQYTQPQPMFQSSRVGMQEGGSVQNTSEEYSGPEFNPSDWSYGGSFNNPFDNQGSSTSGGMKLVEYVNPETGQTRMITVLNGEPIGLVPEGFIPASQEAKQETQDAKQEVETKTEGTREGGDRMDSAGVSSKDSVYSGSLRGNVAENLSGELESAGKGVGLLGNIAGLAGAMIGGPLVGTVAKGFASNLAESNSVNKSLEVASLADLMGYNDIAEDARSKAKSLAEDFDMSITEDMLGKANSKAMGEFNQAVDAAKSYGLSREAFGSDEAFNKALDMTAPTGMSRNEDGGYSASPSQAAAAASTPSAQATARSRPDRPDFSDRSSTSSSGGGGDRGGFGGSSSSSGGSSSSSSGGSSSSSSGGSSSSSGGSSSSSSGAAGASGTAGAGGPSDDDNAGVARAKGGLMGQPQGSAKKKTRKPNQRKKPIKNKRSGLGSK